MVALFGGNVRYVFHHWASPQSGERVWSHPLLSDQSSFEESEADARHGDSTRGGNGPMIRRRLWAIITKTIQADGPRRQAAEKIEFCGTQKN